MPAVPSCRLQALRAVAGYRQELLLVAGLVTHRRCLTCNAAAGGLTCTRNEPSKMALNARS